MIDDEPLYNHAREERPGQTINHPSRHQREQAMRGGIEFDADHEAFAADVPYHGVSVLHLVEPVFDEFALLLGVVATVWSRILASRITERITHSRCIECGYPLKLPDQAMCPECGTAQPEEGTRAP